MPISDQAALDASPVPREVLAERLLAVLPRADPRGRGVPRRPASGQHPARRGRHDERSSTSARPASSTRPCSRRSAGCCSRRRSRTPSCCSARCSRSRRRPRAPTSTALEADLGRFMVLHVSGGTGFDVGMLKAMIDVLQHNHLPVPTSLTLLSRALITLDGTLRTMAPGFAFAQEAQALASPMVMPAADTDAVNEHDAEGAAPGDAVAAHAARARRGDRRPAPVRSAHACGPAASRMPTKPRSSATSRTGRCSPRSGSSGSSPPPSCSLAASGARAATDSLHARGHRLRRPVPRHRSSPCASSRSW